MDKFDREIPADTFARERESLVSEAVNPTNPSLAGRTISPIDPGVAPNIRCLVHRVAHDRLPRAPHIDLVTNAEDPYDVIILRDPRDTNELEALFARCSNPAAALIAFDDAIGPRADAVLPAPYPNTLVETIMGLQPLISRVAALPRLPTGTERAGLLTLALAYTRNLPIEPKWQPNQPSAIGYPILAGIAQPRRMLEELAEAGLLRRRFFERLFVCEQCESARVLAREVCVNCRSSHLAEHPIVHHYACGAQAAQPAFESGNGYRCPKCRKELRHYGVDYDKPGTISVCSACSATMAEPDVCFACVDCGHKTHGDRAQRCDWFAYDLTADGVEAVRTGSLPTFGSESAPRRGHSLRDFKLIVGQQLLLAARYERPLTAWRMQFDVTALQSQVGKPAYEEVRQLVLDIALADVHEGDAFAVLPNGVVVCRPESDGVDVRRQIEAIEKRLKKLLKSPVRVQFKLYERAKVPALLEEIR